MKLGALLLLAAVPAAVLGHYGDPNTIPSSCMPDEQSVKIQGIEGDFCSPPCTSSGTCPTDIPPGVTAKPTCALTSSSGGKYCALVCDPSLNAANQCGKNATCKAISGTGLCTYNDTPKPPSSAHWYPIESPTFEEQSACISVGFTKDGRKGFAGAGKNGVGAQIITSDDHGKTWAALPGNASFNIYLAASTKDDTDAVISGALFQSFSTDGVNFHASENLFLSPAQDAGVIPGSNMYAIPAAGSTFNGIAHSTDGKKWEGTSITGINSTLYLSRYGAYPSKCTWYVTAGNFPETNSNFDKKADAYTHLNRHVRINKGTSRTEFTFKDKAQNDGPANCSEDPENCFSAMIAKTTDCGKTWTTVYDNINKGDNIYPNGIHCITDDHCVAVVEGDSCRILLTLDGGKTWTEQMHDTDKACSLVSVRMLSKTEGWISGGHMSYADFEGRFWHTLDGGKTWKKEAIKGLYTFSFDMTSAQSGYAVALTEASGVQLIGYRDNKTMVSVTL